MENRFINIPQDLLDNLSIEEIAELKIEIDELKEKLEDIEETCNLALNY